MRITTRYSDKLKGYEVYPAGQDKPVKAATDPIPPEWNYSSQHDFEVPPAGTGTANFDIVSGKK